MTSGVTLTDVTRSFRRRRALDRVSLVAGTGILGLLGPNGAGKTTLLRILATVCAPDAGLVRVLGVDPGHPDQRTEIRRRLGYVPQRVGFPRGFTAFEYVDYVAILKEHTDRRGRHDEVRRVLSLVGLANERHSKIRQLSGGMRQRLVLAQALLGEPQLLVLDEPTVGLDPEQRLRYRELVSTLADDRCVLLSTHQTEDVAALCQRVVVLADGRVRFDGQPAQLAAEAAGRVWLADQRDTGATLAWRTGDGRLRQLGEPPPGATLVEPTIEDGYLMLLGIPVATTQVAAA